MNPKSRLLCLVALFAAATPFTGAQVAGKIDPSTSAAANVAAQSAAARQAAAAGQEAATTAQITANQQATAAQQTAEAARNAASADGVNPVTHAVLGTPGDTLANNPGPGTAPVGADASLNTAETVRDIRMATTADRDAVLSRVEANREAAALKVVQLQTAARKLSRESRQRFDLAYREVRSREASLRQSLDAARGATEDTAPNAQSKLAADYEAYAEAIAVAQAAAQNRGTVSR